MKTGEHLATTLNAGLGAMLLAAAAVGCRAAERPLVDEGPLRGHFDGKPWLFASGGTDLFSPDANKYLSTLRDTDADACAVGGGEALMINIPFKPGTYELTLTQTLTFATKETNLSTSTGIIEVHEVTDRTIEAGLYAVYNDNPDYEVSGQFTVEICDVPY